MRPGMKSGLFSAAVMVGGDLWSSQQGGRPNYVADAGLGYASGEVQTFLESAAQPGLTRAFASAGLSDTAAGFGGKVAGSTGAAFVIAPIVCGNAQPVRFIQQQLAHGQGFGGGVPGRCRIGGGMVLGFGGNRLCRDFPPADDDRLGDHRASFRERTTWYPGRQT